MLLVAIKNKFKLSISLKFIIGTKILSIHLSIKIKILYTNKIILFIIPKKWKKKTNVYLNKIF